MSDRYAEKLICSGQHIYIRCQSEAGKSIRKLMKPEAIPGLRKIAVNEIIVVNNKSSNLAA